MQKSKAFLGERIKSLLFYTGTTTPQNSEQVEGQSEQTTETTSHETHHSIEQGEVLVQAHLSKSAFYFAEESNTTDNSVDLYRRPGYAAPNTKSCRGLYPYLPESRVNRNRALSIRSKSSNRNDGGGSGRKAFSFQSLRGNMQPELSRKLYKVIKSSNNLITAHDTAAKERTVIATQLSEWGEQTQDEAVSDISDKVGVILSELGDQEDGYAQNLEESRGILKAIRNTEKSVQPSRDNKAKIADEIQKLKMKEPQSTKIVVLEQELVRAEAENMVAEAQLSNITRQKLKEAYAAEFAAVIERAERQIILAKHGRRLLSLLDDSPITPGDAQRQYVHGNEARQVLNDAEDDLRKWELNLEDEPFHDAQADAVETTPESSVATGAAYGESEQHLNDPSYREEAAQPNVAGPSSASVAV
ncbi:putative Sphingolipid long chain base-responsive protein LSP1 [Seiridium cardinale]|uniref:Sphingolipid long chain base-responsive protein LSP1 n=1 Tax=Seiridium cardinale TaxID=138064 RepID=A0ABR2XCL8_9PEZI